MPISYPNLKLTPILGAIPAWKGTIEPQELLPVCHKVAEGGGRLVALWGSDERQNAAGYALQLVLVTEAGLICIGVPLDEAQPAYPDLSQIFPSALRMQRAV